MICFRKKYSIKDGKSIFPTFAQASELGMMVDLQDVLQRFTFNNPCTLVLGLDTNYLSVEFLEVANAYASELGETAKMTSDWRREEA